MRAAVGLVLTAFVSFSCPSSAHGGTRADPVGVRTITLGRSLEGRRIAVVERGDFDAATKTLVVGCIHGNETAGIAIARRLEKIPAPHELDLWIVANLNPDGAARYTRGNSRGVDLNRNFPWHWRPLRGLFYSGPHALSEPESRLAARLVREVRPSVSVWFHQHLDVVDESGGDVRLERRFAERVGLRLVRLTREPGSAVGWENHVDPSGTAFVVELPAGVLSARAVALFASAVILTSRCHSGRRQLDQKPRAC